MLSLNFAVHQKFLALNFLDHPHQIGSEIRSSHATKSLWGLWDFIFIASNIWNNECNDQERQGKNNTWLSCDVSIQLLIYVQPPSHSKHLL